MPDRFLRRNGFTLTELAIVLVIVALLLGGLLPSLSTQTDIKNNADTQRTLTDIREALVGYAVANGRLPCPASATSHGFASPTAAGPCTSGGSNAFDGFVPAATLGITPTNADGYAIDGWGNPIRYAVSVTPDSGTPTNALVTDIRQYFQNKGQFPQSDLRACADASLVTGGKCEPSEASNTLSNTAAAVVYSLGKNGQAAHGPDEAENLNGDRVFISHLPVPAGNAGGEFDDLVVWISPNTLINRLIAAGRLP